MATDLLNAPGSPKTDPPPRRGWWAVVAVALVALALAVAAFLLLDDGPGNDQTVTPSEPSTTSSASSAPSGDPDATHDLLRGVVDGGPATFPYLAGRALQQPDGTTVELPRAYDQVALVDDRIVATYDDQGNRVLDVLTSSGELLESSPVEANFAVSAASDLVAWATPRGELMTWWDGGELDLGNQGGPIEVAAVTGSPPSSTGSDDLRVYVNNVDGRPPQFVAPDGSVGTVAPGAIDVEDVNGRLAAVQLSYADLGSCSGVYDGEAERFLWQTCDNSLFQFSPDGRYLLGSDPYLDGLGLGSLTVLDVASGAPVARFTIRGGFIAQQTWQDETHPLVVISGPAGWEILRLGLDGTRERIAGPVAAGQDLTHQLLTLPGNR